MSEAPLDGMQPFDFAEGIAVLERTPAVLHAWLGALPRAWTTVTEGAGTWSAFDVGGGSVAGVLERSAPLNRHFNDAGISCRSHERCRATMGRGRLR